MASKTIYKITVLSWDKYNATKKKGHRATLISNSFCNDNKLGTLPLTVRWLFLGIVLTCGDHTRDTVEMNEKQLRVLLESSWSIDRALESLKELQVLTFEKIDLFYNRIEKNRIEKKRNRIARPAGSVVVSTTTTGAGSLVSRVIGKYCEEFKSRYGTNPEILRSDAGKLGRLAKELGEKKALGLVVAYFAMPDAWVVKTRHSIGVLVTRINEIKVFAETGNFVSMAEVRDADKNLRGLQEQASVLNDPEFKKKFDDQKKLAGAS